MTVCALNDCPQSMQEKAREEHCQECEATFAFFSVDWHSSHTKDTIAGGGAGEAGAAQRT